MKIKNIHGLSAGDIQQEVNDGARFVYYLFTLSLLVITVKRNSGVYLVRSNKSQLLKSLPFTLVTLFLGWWGIPFGPKYTLESLRTNLRGGRDVTDDVMATVAGYVLFEETQQNKQGLSNQ